MLPDAITYDSIDTALWAVGLMSRGGFRPEAVDQLPAGTQTVVLVGNGGPPMWQIFSSAPGSSDNGLADPLDAWTRRIVDPLAESLGATALYPFDGPPYHPFQTWAMRAEPVWPSPVGPLIHPEFGLWLAYRAALCFAHRLALPANPGAAVPCLACEEKPCLSACPVGAFEGGGYDVPACTGHIATEDRTGCMGRGCAARRACPIGRAYAHEPVQARFHMEKFLQNHA